MDGNDDNTRFLHALKDVVSSGKRMNGIVVDRGSHEFVVVISPERSTGYVKQVTDDLSKKFKVNKCFNIVESGSKKLYGIFLKK